jgi:putative alpha-1,2-mannosidase
MTSPTAQLPFGMVQWGPDTHIGEWYNYAYDDSKILGFSLTHISGAGCRLFNDLPVLPWIGEVKANPGIAATYSLPFNHSAEVAHPGYYAVTADNGIKTELTAALRSGMARFTFPAGATRTLFLEVGSSATEDLPASKSDTSTIQLAGNMATGKLTSGHFCGGGPTYTLYFTIQFSEPFASTGANQSSCRHPRNPSHNLRQSLQHPPPSRRAYMVPGARQDRYHGRHTRPAHHFLHRPLPHASLAECLQRQQR